MGIKAYEKPSALDCAMASLGKKLIGFRRRHDKEKPIEGERLAAEKPLKTLYKKAAGLERAYHCKMFMVLAVMLIACWLLPMAWLKQIDYNNFEVYKNYTFFWILGDMLQRFPVAPDVLPYALGVFAFTLLPAVLFLGAHKPSKPLFFILLPLFVASVIVLSVYYSDRAFEFYQQAPIFTNEYFYSWRPGNIIPMGYTFSIILGILGVGALGLHVFSKPSKKADPLP